MTPKLAPSKPVKWFIDHLTPGTLISICGGHDDIDRLIALVEEHVEIPAPVMGIDVAVQKRIATWIEQPIIYRRPGAPTLDMERHSDILVLVNMDGMVVLKNRYGEPVTFN